MKMTCDTWHLADDTWHVTRDMWHMVGGEYSLKISAPQLLRLGTDSVLKILNERYLKVKGIQEVPKGLRGIKRYLNIQEVARIQGIQEAP